MKWRAELLVLLAIGACTACNAGGARAPDARSAPTATTAPAASAASAASSAATGSGTRWFRDTVSGAGRPVVFLPDLEAPGDIWDTTVAHLQGHVEAHVIDIAGFAGQPPATGPVLPGLRDALAAYLRDLRDHRDHEDHHGKSGAVVVGHMFGATVAYSLALDAPDVVGGIVAVDALPTVGDGDPQEVRLGATAGRHALASASPEQFASMTTHRIDSMIASADVAARVAAEAVRSSPASVAEAFYEMMTLDLRPRLADLKAPVLVIATLGNQKDEDRAEFEARWHRQVDLIPRHTFLVVADSKHYVMFDDAPAFFGALDRFLAEMPAP